MGNEGSKAVIKEKSEKTDFFRSLEGSSEVHRVDLDSVKAPGMSYISNDSIKSSGRDSGVLNPSTGKVQSMHPDSMKTIYLG